MTRPRIRSLKPENWQDEAVGRVSHQARLLRDVLITLADDDGRWRHLASAIIGHGYPYDDITPAKINRWSRELHDEGLIVLYTHAGQEYGCFPTWHLHQYIQRYVESKLPPCDDQRVITRERAKEIKAAAKESERNLTDTSGTSTGQVPEGYRHHAQALGSGSGSLPVPDPSQQDARALAAVHPQLGEVLAILEPLPNMLTEPASIASALNAHPDADAVSAAHRVASMVHAKQNRTAHTNSLLLSVLQRSGQTDNSPAPGRTTTRRPSSKADMYDRAAGLLP